MRDIAEIVCAKSRPGRGRPKPASPLASTVPRTGLLEISQLARASLERALAIFDPERDSDLAFRFAQDIGVSITAYLALVLWPLGEVDRAREVRRGDAGARDAKSVTSAPSSMGIFTSPYSR